MDGLCDDVVVFFCQSYINILLLIIAVSPTKNNYATINNYLVVLLRIGYHRHQLTRICTTSILFVWQDKMCASACTMYDTVFFF